MPPRGGGHCRHCSSPGTCSPSLPPLTYRCPCRQARPSAREDEGSSRPHTRALRPPHAPQLLLLPLLLLLPPAPRRLPRIWRQGVSQPAPSPACTAPRPPIGSAARRGRGGGLAALRLLAGGTSHSSENPGSIGLSRTLRPGKGPRPPQRLGRAALRPQPARDTPLRPQRSHSLLAGRSHCGTRPPPGKPPCSNGRTAAPCRPGRPAPSPKTPAPIGCGCCHSSPAPQRPGKLLGSASQRTCAPAGGTLASFGSAQPAGRGSRWQRPAPATASYRKPPGRQGGTCRGRSARFAVALLPHHLRAAPVAAARPPVARQRASRRWPWPRDPRRAVVAGPRPPRSAALGFGVRVRCGCSVRRRSGPCSAVRTAVGV